MPTRKLLFFPVILFITTSCFAQVPEVDSLFRSISAMGKEYKRLAGEKDPKNISSIAAAVKVIDDRIKATAIIGVDSILLNIHRFSDYLGYYADLINNPVRLPESIKPERVFKQLDSTARFLSSFDTLSYDTSSVQEMYYDVLPPSPDDTSVAMVIPSDHKIMSGFEKDAGTEAFALAKMASLKCCKIRVKVRVRVVVSSPKKTYDRVVDALEGAVNTAGKLIPEEVKKQAIIILGTAVDVSGDMIHIINDAQQQVFSFTLNTLEFLRTLQERTAKEVLQAVTYMHNSVGIQLPPELEQGLDNIITAQSNLYKEVLTGLDKSLQLNYKINDMTADALKQFAKYLLLSTDFPRMVVQKKASLKPVDAYAQVNQQVLQNAVNTLFKNTIDLDTTVHKGFKATFNSNEHSVYFDENSGTILLELGDINVKGMYLPGGLKDLFAPSTTINIKKIKIQLIPELRKDDLNTIFLQPRVYFLDIKNLMPLYDKMVSWIIQKQFLEPKTLPIALDSIFHNRFALRAAKPDTIDMQIGNLGDYAIADGRLILGIDKATPGAGQPADPVFTDSGLSVTISVDLFRSLAEGIIKTHDGIRYSLKSRAKKFDDSYNYLHLKKLNTFKPEGNKFFVDITTQVHMRRFLGRKPKLNFEVTHTTFYLEPKLEKEDDGSMVMNMYFIPAVDRLEIKNLNKRLTRKAVNLLKAAHKPAKFASFKLEALQHLEFENPFKKDQNLLDRFRQVSLVLDKGVFKINVY